ncbi:C40 family peptidase [Gordonia sihwensis]|uniref:C40 family peptidase n=1 Tax=Gordonia sihwensis TaxID=173559 RepID=UPI003D959FBB
MNGTSYNGVASTTSRVETRYDVTGHQIRELVDQAIHGVARPRRAVSLARQVVDSGMLYSWGGGDLNGPTLGISGPGLGVNDDRVVGMDCSSFARYVVFHAFGVQLPRTSGAQWSASVPVRLDRAQPGDLVFPVGTRGVDHVQIYIGDGLIAEQYQSGTPARIIPINPVDEIRRPIGIPL